MKHCLLQPLSLLHISHLQPAAKSGVSNITLPRVFPLDYDDNTSVTLKVLSTQTYVGVICRKHICIYICLPAYIN